MIATIIMTRHAEQRTTGILTNLLESSDPNHSDTFESIDGLLGARLMSRLMERGVIINFNWGDYRNGHNKQSLPKEL